MFLTSPALIHTHPDFLVVSKPANISFHADGKNDENPSETPLLAHIRQLCREHYGDDTLFPVHRLDHLTSGLLLFARTPEAASRFGQMFTEGEIGKCYLALSARQPSKKQGWIKGNMIKSRNGSWRLSNGDGQHAITQFFSYGLGKVGEETQHTLRLFLVRPYTGRTHQIRVALKSVGSPILGDTRYGGAPADRGYLHALSLRFEWQGKPCHFYLPPTEGEFFQHTACLDKLETIGDPWELPWAG